MYIELFQNLGLSKNEAQIYEELLKQGEASVSTISSKTNINRRNIYDVLNRMMEKGLAIAVLQKGETQFKPVDPGKLMEILKEKESILQKSMPDLETLYRATPKENEVYIYRGPEGWKNYMRDMLRIGEPAYFISAKGGWLDQRVKDYFPTFMKEAQRKKMKFYHLFDARVPEECPEILKYVTNNYKFLPKEYSTPSAIDIFGDHVNVLADVQLGGQEEDFSFTVIVNQTIAGSFKVWFKYMWDFCPDVKGSKPGKLAI
ncbi:MAG: helix-turn-helix domain-containing protein [Candidatus Kerfeldbacteria bacterium]